MGNDSLNSDIGWRLATPSNGLLSYQEQANGCPDSDSAHYDNSFIWTYIDRNGVSHLYSGYTRDSNCIGTEVTESLDEYPEDGTPYRLKATSSNGMAILPSGATIADTVYTDSNGNFSSGPAYSGGTVSDTSGSAVTLTGGRYNPTSFSGGNEEDGTGVSRDPLIINYKDSVGNIQPISVAYRMYQVDLNLLANIQLSPSEDFTVPRGLVDSIVFPDGRKYLFTYQASSRHSGAVTGRLESMTVPTGATITYIYPADASSIGDGAFSSLTRMDPDGTTVYQRSISNPWDGISSAWTTK